jgi:choline kinase
MRGIVLAAGEGRRLRPLTDAIPKTLLQVDGETTILDIALRNLRHVEIKEIAIVTGYAAEAVDIRLEDLERRHDVDITIVPNTKASVWNNAYSLWLAREMFGEGVLICNGDTVHPWSVEERMLERRESAPVLIALDDQKRLADEEMKVVLDTRGRIRRINKAIDPSAAHGEYIGVTLVDARTASALADALEATWRRDPGLYYEDGFQELVDRGGEVRTVPIGAVEWVEVDDHKDLARAREIACRC